MIKRFIRLLPLAALCLAARENPFLPAEPAGTPRSCAVSSVSAAEAPQSAGTRRQKQKKERKAEIASFQNMRLLFRPGSVRIETKDRLLKDFTIAKPTAIILDFKSDADFPTRKRAVKTLPFKEIRMGIHPGFYRVVLETNTSVAYRIEPFRYGYILTLDR